MRWLDEILLNTSEAETPERYIYWSGLAAVAAITRKNVYLDKFYYKLYPNIYVLLVSARSALRKGFAIGLAKNLIEYQNNTRVITGQNSIQGIIKEFSMQRTLDNGPVLNDAQGILLAPEFDSFILEDPKAFSILTDLYNTHEHNGKWTKSLKGSEVETLKNPCICLLAASNAPLLESLLTQKDIEGGFLGRTMVVYESKRRSINSLVRRPIIKFDPIELAKGLSHLKDIKGEFQLDIGVDEIFDRWYKNLAVTISKTEDRAGVLDRLGDSVLKVAMLISLSEGDSLLIRSTHLAEAIHVCEECFSGATEVSHAGGKSELAKPYKTVMKELIVSTDYEIYRAGFLKKHWPEVDVITFDKVLDMMTSQGLVEIVGKKKVEGKWDVVYKLVNGAMIAKQYLQFKREIN